MRQTPCCGKYHESDYSTQPETDGTMYYVTVRDAGKTGFLLGPYRTHREALANVERGKQLALEHSSRAWFYAYGTSKAQSSAAVVFA